jgi:hypothetical protein
MKFETEIFRIKKHDAKRHFFFCCKGHPIGINGVNPYQYYINLHSSERRKAAFLFYCKGHPSGINGVNPRIIGRQGLIFNLKRHLRCHIRTLLLNQNFKNIDNSNCPRCILHLEAKA